MKRAAPSMAEAAKDAAANTGGERRSRRGTWSLIAVGFSVLLLLLVTIAVGVQSYIVSRGFRSGQTVSALQRQMLGLRDLQLMVSQVERAGNKAQTSGKPEDLAAFREDLGRLVVIAGQTNLSTLGVSAATQLRAESYTGNLTEVAPVTGQFGEALDRQYQDLSAKFNDAAEDASKWQKRSFHLIFLTNNLTMLLLITGGGLLLLYAGWHLDARQKLVEARQAVLKAERDRASFVAAAGHDLRQPLQAISLFLTTLSHRAEDTETKSLLVKIGQAASSMRRMINGLLDVAKLDAGLVSADQIDEPLGDMFASLREEFERQAEAKGLVLVIEPSDAVVHTDPLLLESMLRNLLANAVNYTNQGHVSMSARPNGRRIVITVRDTGPGIAADELDLIFRDFYRVGGSGGGGLGLGLGIVQRMAKLIYAQVAVDSTLGLGTRFTVAVSSGVPAQPAQPAQPALPAFAPLAPSLPLPPLTPATPVPVLAPAHAEASPDPSPRVLLVDDNDTLRGALATQLIAWGVNVTQASDVRAACDLVRDMASPVELAIVDYDLGKGHTGLELLHRLSALEGRRVAGLVITGSGDPEVHRALSRSEYDWLQKPFDPALLREAITRLRATATPGA